MSTVSTKLCGLMGQSINMVSDAPQQLSTPQQIALQQSIDGVEDAYFVMDVGRVLSQYSNWAQQFPNVQPHYAVKCNSDPVLLNILANLGCGFDCASKKEMEMVFSAVAELAPSRIVYANPCKTRSHIKAARDYGVSMMTFDNEEELHKIKSIFPQADLILRINVGDPTAQCQLNVKFGCEPEKEGPGLLKVAAQLGLKVIGISFHVGSGCRDPSAYRVAIEHASHLFDVGLQLGHDMTVLDIGGGFPGEQDRHPFFAEIAATVNDSVTDYFPAGRALRVIAEPGRYFGCAAYQLCCNIIAKTKCSAAKITKLDEDSDAVGFMYYINDGVYGSFNCILYDHTDVTAQPLFEQKSGASMAAVWGPTCDGLDVVLPQTRLPIMEEGDWLIFKNMGAYTLAAGSEFNGFPRPAVHYHAGETMFNTLLDICKIDSIKYDSDDDVDSLASYTSALTTDSDAC